MHRGLDTITKLHKDWQHRFTLERPDLLKRYLDGRINVHLEFGAWSTAKRDPVSLYSILDSPLIPTRSGARKFNAESGVRTVIFGDIDALAQHQNVSHHDKQPMFVCEVEVMDYLQNRIGRIRRRIRLQSLDQRSLGTRDALYYSVTHSLFKLFRSLADREVNPLIVGEAVLTGERPNNVIESGSEMVNNLSSNDGKSQWDRRPQDFEGISVTFWLALANDGISATVKESRNCNIEMTDLLFGPLNLGPAPVEGL
jgi:hypothetical protein